MTDKQKAAGRRSLSGEAGATKNRQIRQTDELWTRWLTLAKVARMKGGARELMESAIQRWEQDHPEVVAKAEKIIEFEKEMVEDVGSGEKV